MSFDPAPLSKTAKYKKITKPLLERKRRARINRCLDELKDLMVGALEIDDDNLSKLEKADILELTVNHLTKLHSPRDPVIEAKKFQAGFGQCAAEACRFIMSVPDLDENVSQSLISHLSGLITSQPLTIQVPDRPSFSPPTSPSSMVSDRQQYCSDHERSPCDLEESVYTAELASQQWTHRYNFRMPYKPSPPPTGLLTTIDKVIPQVTLTPHYNNSPEQHNGAPAEHKSGPYFNRVPAEAKDAILQKIRQHIMDKRGNDSYSNCDVNFNTETVKAKYLNKDEQTGNEMAYQYSNFHNNDSLDLRKVRSPKKSIEVAPLPEKEIAHSSTNRLDATPAAESKVEVTANLPEQCELPMDYSNLPPKKKRKLIEYQEYKKREEARRQLDAFCAEKKERSEGPPRPPAEHDADPNKWRPW